MIKMGVSHETLTQFSRHGGNPFNFTQQTYTCSKLTVENLEKVVKYAQS